MEKKNLLFSGTNDLTLVSLTIFTGTIFDGFTISILELTAAGGVTVGIVASEVAVAAGFLKNENNFV